MDNFYSFNKLRACMYMQNAEYSQPAYQQLRNFEKTALPGDLILICHHNSVTSERILLRVRWPETSEELSNEHPFLQYFRSEYPNVAVIEKPTIHSRLLGGPEHTFQKYLQLLSPDDIVKFKLTFY